MFPPTNCENTSGLNTFLCLDLILLSNRKDSDNETPPSQLPTFADIRLMNLKLFRTGLLDEAVEKIKQLSKADLLELETVNAASDPEEVFYLCRKKSYYKAKDALVEKILAD